MTDAIIGHGTALKAGDGGCPESFTTIAEVKSISGPSLELGIEDASNMDSTGGWREKVPTLLDAGTIDFTVNYDPADSTLDATSGLINDMENSTLRNFQLVMSDSGTTTWSFSAYVTAFSPEYTTDGIVEANISLTLSGQPTLA